MQQTADVIATLGDQIVVIQRLSEPLGLAFPGGKKDPGEGLRKTATREFLEETGLTLAITHTLSYYDAPGRDPRGHVSQLFAGTAIGRITAERGKTIVKLMSVSEIMDQHDRFILDHYDMFQEYYLKV